MIICYIQGESFEQNSSKLETAEGNFGSCCCPRAHPRYSSQAEILPQNKTGA